MKRSWRVAAVTAAAALTISACGGADDDNGDEPNDEAAADDTDDGGDADDGGDDGSEPSGDATEIRLTTLLPPGGTTGALFEWWAEELETRTDGEVAVEIVYGGALVSGLDTLPGLNDGRAEVGQVVPAYYPNEMPLWNVNMVPLVGANQGARPLAFQELYENNDAFREEFEGRGVRMIGYLPNNSSTVAFTDRIESLDEMDGMRVRIASAPLAEVYGQFGAEGVFMPVEEVYESLQRGILDGNAYPFDTQIAGGITEVAPYVYPDLGQSGGSVFAIGQEVYDGLSDDVKAVLDELQIEWYERLDEELIAGDQQACEDLLSEGGEVVLWSDEDSERAAEATDVGLDVWRGDAAEAGAEEDAIESVWSDYSQYTDEFEGEVEYVDGVQACADEQ